MFLSADGATRIFPLDECLSLVHSHVPYSSVTTTVLLANDPATQLISQQFSILLGFLRYVRTPISHRERLVQCDSRAVLIAKTTALRTQRFLLLQRLTIPATAAASAYVSEYTSDDSYATDSARQAAAKNEDICHLIVSDQHKQLLRTRQVKEALMSNAHYRQYIAQKAVNECKQNVKKMNMQSASITSNS